MYGFFLQLPAFKKGYFYEAIKKIKRKRYLKLSFSLSFFTLFCKYSAKNTLFLVSGKIFAV